MVSALSTFVSAKVAKPRLPIPFFEGVVDTDGSFFVPGGDFLDDRLVTFCTAVWPWFIRKW
jgi:hypothetical protein